MEQKELIIRVLATMRTDLAAKDFILSDIGRLDGAHSFIDGGLRKLIIRTRLDLASARETLEDIIDDLNAK